MNEPVTQAAAEAIPLEGIYRRYARQGIRFAFSMLGNRADAEEVSQEAFCRLLAANPDWQTGMTSELEDRFPALFFKTIRNQCIDLTRKRSRHRQVALTTEPVAKRTTEVAKLETTVRRLMEDMPCQWSEALKLKVNGQLSYAEIAEVLEASHAQVRTWIYRARRKLETELRKAEQNA